MLINMLLLSLFLTISTCNQQCSNEAPPRVPKYHLLEKCYRSKLNIAGKANFTSLSSCERLGIEKKALAINYSPPEALRMMRKRKNMTIEYTCEVLQCAEADGGLSLENDTRYDYYSIYAKPLPHINSTCVPATGMFYLPSKKLNYTEADLFCRNMSSVLTDITSEERTDALAQVLAGASVDAAYVGLRRNNGSNFYSVTGDSLDCTTYRAWAPGHPRRAQTKYDCVLLSRHKTWRTSACNKQYYFLCELMPGGPYKRRSIFKSQKEKRTITIEQNPEHKTESRRFVGRQANFNSFIFKIL